LQAELAEFSSDNGELKEFLNEDLD